MQWLEWSADRSAAKDVSTTRRSVPGVRFNNSESLNHYNSDEPFRLFYGMMGELAFLPTDEVPGVMTHLKYTEPLRLWPT